MPSPIIAQTQPHPAQQAARRAAVPEPEPFEGASENERIDSGTIEFRELWQDKGEGLTFGDLIDIVNPLQHIPVISTAYRALTGDQLGLGARLIGGALYGGGVGFALGVAQAAVEDASGRDIGENVLAFIKDPTGADDAPAESADTVASAPAASPAPAVAARDPATLGAIAPAALAAPAPAAAAIPAAIARPAAPKIFAAPPAPPAADAPTPERQPPVPARPDQIAGRNFPARPDALHRARPVDHVDSARVAAAVERARRAQAAMLLANVAPPAPSVAPREDDDVAPGHKTDRAEAVKPAAAAAGRAIATHPNAIPANASPQWLSNAMERALGKYEDTMRLRRNAPAGG